MLLVDEVYKNQVPRNRPRRPKHEPRLSHLLDLLKVALLREDRRRVDEHIFIYEKRGVANEREH